MNTLVSFRSGSAGTLSLRPDQREAAQTKIQSNFVARLKGIQRAVQGESAAKSTEGGSQTQKAASKAANDNVVTGSNDLDRDAFLQLLVQQLSNQDPLEPTKNEDMLAQLAQFSALEQSENLNRNFEELANQFNFLTGNIDQLNFISAQGMLGKFVEGVAADGSVISGEVESVHLDGSIVVLTVDGQPMPMSGVVGVANERPDTDADS